MIVRAVKLYDKVWSLITQDKPSRFANILWVESHCGIKVGEQTYLPWSGGEELSDHRKIVQINDFKFFQQTDKESLIQLINELHGTTHST